MRISVSALGLLVAVFAEQPAMAAKNASIDASVFRPMERRNFPKTFAAWGTQGARKIDRYRAKAARIAARNARCNHVEFAELSDQRSTPPNQITIFVDCRNGERFYLTSAEMDNNATASSVAETTVKYDDPEARRKLEERCQELTLAALVYPSSFSRTWSKPQFYRAPQGNVVVTIDFTAKTRLGNETPQRARCVVSHEGINPPEITGR